MSLWLPHDSAVYFGEFFWHLSLYLRNCESNWCCAGEPTGQVTIFGCLDAAKNKGEYKHLHTVQLPRTTGALVPFLGLSGARQLEVRISRSPDGPVGPMLEYHPQLLQAPIAQLRAFSQLSDSIINGTELPIPFRLAPVSDSILHDGVSGGIAGAGCEFRPDVLSQFVGGGLVVEVSRLQNPVAVHFEQHGSTRLSIEIGCDLDFTAKVLAVSGEEEMSASGVFVSPV